MSLSTKDSNQAQERSILKELDDLMGYISDNNDAGLQEDLIDPSFFIGNIEGTHEDIENIIVPTLTSVAEDLTREAPENQAQRQPGLFSSRVDEIKRANEQVPEASLEHEYADLNIDRLVDALVAEHLPKLEAELREKIRARLETKK